MDNASRGVTVDGDKILFVEQSAAFGVFFSRFSGTVTSTDSDANKFLFSHNKKIPSHIELLQWY